MEEALAKSLEGSLFTTTKPKESAHRCVIAISRKDAVTYRHGSSHSHFKMGQTIKLHNVVDPTEIIEAHVIAISEAEDKDVIIFEAINGQHFEYFPIGSGSIYRGQKYFQLTIGQGRYRDPVWKDGIVSKKRDGRFMGSSHGQLGDSGSAIFDSSGQFIGMTIAKQDLTLSKKAISDPKLKEQEIAEHHPETVIISWDRIDECLREFKDSESPPPKKPMPQSSKRDAE